MTSSEFSPLFYSVLLWYPIEMVEANSRADNLDCGSLDIVRGITGVNSVLNYQIQPSFRSKLCEQQGF